jgi:hypothetical protein
MEKKSPRVRHGGSDVKLGSDLGLERFQAQPKWEIPAETDIITFQKKFTE